MTSEAEHERRRDLQRRAFAPGQSLSDSEREELRRLSLANTAPAADAAPQSVAAPVAGAAVAPAVRTEVTEAPAAQAQNIDGAASPQGARRIGRLVLAGVIAAVLGLGAGWLLSPRTDNPVPPMTAAQQKVQDALISANTYDPGSVRFAGHSEGASVWTAKKDGVTCIVLSVEGEESAACAKKYDEYLGPMAVTGRRVEHSDTVESINAILTPTLTGEWAVLMERWKVNWADGLGGQYDDGELAMLEALRKDGLNPFDLRIGGYDGRLPVWVSDGPQRCVAIVDPDTKIVRKSCAISDGDRVKVTLPVGKTAYNVTWTSQGGPVLTVIRNPAATTATTVTTCDPETGECASIDDTTGDVG